MNPSYRQLVSLTPTVTYPIYNGLFFLVAVTYQGIRRFGLSRPTVQVEMVSKHTGPPTKNKHDSE